MVKKFQQFKEKTLPKSVEGKVFVITGTTSGTGFIAARTVGQLGGTCVLLNRKSKRSDDMLIRLKELVPDGKFDPIVCDLMDFASVNSAIEKIQEKYPKVYCLSNNAGIMATPDRATVDGFDEQMQVNHLSHFLLAAKLFPQLEAAAEEYGDARIVSHSSHGRHWCGATPLKDSKPFIKHGLEEAYFQKFEPKSTGHLGGDDLKMMQGGCYERYFHSKLANSVFTYALDQKLTAKQSKVRAICAHPGASKTSLDKDVNFGFCWNLVIPMFKRMMQSPDDGTMGLLTGMMDPNAKSGVLYGPKNGFYGNAVPNPPKPYETDSKSMAMLWRTSEAATGVKFLD